MIVYLLSKFITIFFGMLYPAYASYKAIKTKDAKEYVQWMMYWIVFAVYSVVEIFLDTFVGFWFPFYYEVKILFMFWMLSPTTRGGSTLYRNFIHPALSLHEKDIDGYLADVRRKTGNMVTRWGSKALSYVTDSFVKVILRTPNTLQYYLESTQRPDGRRMGHYGKTDNQGNMYEADTDAMDNRYYQDDDNSIMDVSNDNDAWNDSFSDATPAVNVRTKNVKANRIDKDPTFNPRGVGRKEGPMPKKMNNEFGNFSMVTAQDGSMQSKPIIFGWYPNMAPSDLPPDISSGLIPSVYPSIIPTVPFIAPQTNLSESATSDASNKISTQSEKSISADKVVAATTPVVERVKSEDQDSDSFFDCEEPSAKSEKREPEVKQEPEVKKQESEVKKQEPDVKKPDPINISANIKVVTKATLQGFDEKDSSVKNAPSQSQRSVDNLTRHTSTESLAAIHRKTASLTSLSKLDKTKARKSFSGTENKPKPGLFSTQSFRRVLHPFVSSKPLSSSHSSKNIARSSTNVDATEKKSSATKSDKS